MTKMAIKGLFCRMKAEMPKEKSSLAFVDVTPKSNNGKDLLNEIPLRKVHVQGKNCRFKST